MNSGVTVPKPKFLSTPQYKVELRLLLQIANPMESESRSLGLFLKDFRRWAASRMRVDSLVVGCWLMFDTKAEYNTGGPSSTWR